MNCRCLVLLLGWLVPLCIARSAGIDFNRDIRPVLSKSCFQCHGPDKNKRKAGLRLDTREGAIRLRDGNRAIDPVNLAASTLLHRIKSTDPDVRMPPLEAKSRLSVTEIGLLREWVMAGGGYDTHWAFKKPARHPLPMLSPAMQAWVNNSIDSFIAARHEAASLTPSAEANKATLLRRLFLDLVGLSPSAEQVEKFSQDMRPDAFNRVVDELLQSPRYGERWGRHWLDAARYADSDGYSHDAAREMWPYRDWVIDALNKDLPFDRFIIEQLAGDLLADATQVQRVATGFHRNTQINTEGGVDKEQFRVDSIFDRIATTGEVMFGLTLGCAQCHDHKYDPISQLEYYRLFAFYNSADEPRIEAPREVDLALRAAHDARVKEHEASLKLLTADNPKRNQVDADLAKLKKARPRLPTTLVMARRKEPRTTRRFIQGDFTRPAEVVQADTPAVLHNLVAPNPDRLDFARWVADRDNPLLARVTVNRTWQHFFGIGIVETENDFGSQGTPPTHPKLLDWLAIEFMDCGWSLKHLHRLIVTSAAYRQASTRRADLDQADPYNKLLARQARFRLDAEVIRDVALASSGLLTLEMGGPGVFPPQPEGCMDLGQHRKTWKASSGGDRYRRAAYTYRWRNTPHPALKVFDAPDAVAACTRRLRSNTPLQALTLMNDPAFFEIGIGLAKRILSSDASNDVDRVRLGFQLCLGREPDGDELRVLLDLVGNQRNDFAVHPDEAKKLVTDATTNFTELAAWAVASRVLLNLDETITRE